jgi:hypothetical protein
MCQSGLLSLRRFALPRLGPSATGSVVAEAGRRELKPANTRFIFLELTSASDVPARIPMISPTA